MESDVTPTPNLVHRRFFLSDIHSAPRLFCYNVSDGFAFGQINNDGDELICESLITNHFGLQANHLCWLSDTIYRPSQKTVTTALTASPTVDRNQNASLVYTFDDQSSTQKLKCLNEAANLTPSSIDYNQALDQVAISHLNGTVKIYNASQYHLSSQNDFHSDGVLHQLKWNPVEPNLLLLAHQNRLNIFDYERHAVGLTLNYNSKEHLADCTWKTNDILIGRHRQQILVWDKRTKREPIRNEVLDVFGQSEKLKCSIASPQHLISVYDTRLAKIKIYDFRFLTMRQVESFGETSSSFLDYYWTVDKMAIVVATHQGILHWIDTNVPIRSKPIPKR